MGVDSQLSAEHLAARERVFRWCKYIPQESKMASGYVVKNLLCNIKNGDGTITSWLHGMSRK
jgi:hypothetical protein